MGMLLVPLDKAPTAKNRLIMWHLLNALYAANGRTPVLATAVSNAAVAIGIEMQGSAVVSELHKYKHARKV